MNKFSGEFGSITKRITFVGRPQDQTGMAEVSVMFTRMFGSYLPMKWVKIWDITAVQDVRKALDNDETVIFAEMPWHNPALQKVLLNSRKGRRVGVLLWDSDEIPENFIRILRTFDKLITPTAFIQETVRRHIPEIDVVVIPLAIDTRRFALSAGARSSRRGKNIKRIGVIASQHPRKNLDLLLEAVGELWSEGHKFEFVISGFLKQGALFHHVAKTIDPKLRQKFLRISEEQLSEADYVYLLESLDILVSVSSGEGFNIPARQALSSGLPILISEIPGHRELFGLTGVTTIPTSGKLPAVYPEFGGKISGTQELISKSNIKLGVLVALKAPDPDPESISESRVIWDYRNLEFRYRRELFEFSKDLKQTKSKRNNLIVVGHDAGFFALFNTFVSIQNSWTGSHGFENIYPDWRVASIQKFWKVDDFTSFCYGKPEDGNIYFKLFDTQEQFSASESEIEKIMDHALKGHSFNASADPNLTFVNADKLYRSMGFDAWRKSMNSRLGGLRPNISVRERLDSTFKNVSPEAYLIGMHVRHPSHAMEQPGKKIALAFHYIKLAQELVNNEQRRNPGRPVHIFLATDQDSVINEFRASFGNDLITISGVSRVTDKDTNAYDALIDSKKLLEGFQVQHLNAKNKANWNLGLAEDVIADAWGLSRCDVLVHTVSNVATAVLFINPAILSIPIYPDLSFQQIQALQVLRNKTQIL